MTAKSQPASLDHLLLSKASSAREEVALESAMQSLALDAFSPIALELAATSGKQAFLLRSSHPVAQRHLAQQIQARYPQVQICPAPFDPLALQAHEECSMVELRPGAASYLPLRSWRPRELLAEGTDPLLGILGACQNLPDQIRVVAHLALLPASPTWSASHRRRAVEHPLAKEQERARLRQNSKAPNPAGLLFLIPVVLLLLVLRAHPVRLPGWLIQAASALLHGQMPHLSFIQAGELIGGGLGLLLCLALFLVGFALLRRAFGGAGMYDRRLVDEKTARPAYRVRLRLTAITTLPQDTQAGVAGISEVEAGIQKAQTAEENERHGWLRLGLWAKSKSKHLAQTLRTRLLAHGERLKQRVHALRSWFSLSSQERQAARRQRRQQRKIRRETKRQARQRAKERKDMLRMLTAAYRQYHLASGGYFRTRRVSARRAHRYVRIVSGQGVLWRLRWWVSLRFSRHLLSVADLATLWHLPQRQDLPDLNHIEPAQSRTLPVPPILTVGNGYPIGTSSHAGRVATVFFPLACLRQNMLAVASTGKGKSNLFFLLAQAYLRAKASGSHEAGGFVGVDPHGDLIDLLLGCLPAELEDQVEVIDLSDRSFPVGLNPLDLSAGQDRDKVIENVLQIISALWDLDAAPRTRNVLEYACKTLAEANLTFLQDDPSTGPDRQYTLLDVVPLLRQDNFRHAVMEQLDGDPVLRDWWEHYYERLDSSLQADFSSSVITRLSKFASTRISRRMLGQPRSTLDLAEIIRQEKLLLIKGASGDVGSDLASLMVSLLVGLFQIHLAEQARVSPERRQRFFVLIDEFQTLSGIDYQTMLAELRKYGGSFALATQSLAYLDHLDRRDHTLRATVLANIDHLFAFAMSADDARLLHLDGVEPEDITGLSDYECYARLSLNGRRLPLFSLHLVPAPPSDAQQQQRVRERSRQRSGRRPVEDVDEMLQMSQLRRRTMKPEQKKRHKRGEYDGYEYMPVLTTDQDLKKVRGERKRGSGKKTGREDEAQTPPEVLPRHMMYEETVSSAAEKEDADTLRARPEE